MDREIRVYKSDDLTAVGCVRQLMGTVGVGGNIRVVTGGETFDIPPTEDAINTSGLFRNGLRLYTSLYAEGGDRRIEYRRVDDRPFDSVFLRMPTNNLEQRKACTDAGVKVAEVFRTVPPEMELQNIGSGPLQTVIDAQLLQLAKLDELTMKAQFDLSKAREQVESDRKKNREDLEAETKRQKEEVNRLADERKVQLEAQLQDLERRENDLLLKSNTKARRELHSKQQDLVKTMVSNFASMGRFSATWFLTFFLYVGFLSVAGYIAITSFERLSALSQTAAMSQDPVRFYFMGRSVVASITFIVGFYTWIRWMERIDRSRTEREEQLQSVEVDTYRSNWLVETAFEWEQAGRGPLSELLVEKLSHNLFVGPSGPAEEPTSKSGVRDTLAGLNIKTPGFEMKVDGSTKDEKLKASKEKEKE